MKPIRESGLWKCPYCEFKAYSKAVVEHHMLEQHKEKLKELKESERRKRKERKRKREEREEVDYVADLDHQRVRIILHDGRELTGKLHSKAKYHIKLETDDGTYVINKAFIVMYIPLSVRESRA